MSTHPSCEMETSQVKPDFYVPITLNYVPAGLSCKVKTEIHELIFVIRNFLEKQTHMKYRFNEHVCVFHVNGYDENTGVLIERFDIQMIRTDNTDWVVEFTPTIRNGRVDDYCTRCYRAIRNVVNIL